MNTESTQAAEVSADARALFSTMSTMRAMRRLRPEPVPDETLEQLIQAAVWGPSGGNMQCYEYVVVTDREVMARLAPLWKRCVDAYLATTGKYAPKGMDDAAYGRMVAAIEYQRDHFADTPALVVPCYRFPEPRIEEEGLVAYAQALGPAGVEHMTNTQTRFQTLAEGSCVYPGVQNLLLAARALGLAANVTIWHLMLEQEWKEALGIPEDMQTFAAVPIGWPKGNFGPVRRRPVADVIHRDHW
ncbi:nitroreductase family protein [Streptomyces laculatispora]|uniref:nitroreductase family protein n=1 Tax=Streptomyces laculatispora TaxID=887464 RepID=UPI001A947942|nr:nitroreductase family protein [Streptomyces laculatispora]MBO0913678.1 nitroreductase family protein [Streptomyces laculatispora]